MSSSIFVLCTLSYQTYTSIEVVYSPTYGTAQLQLRTRMIPRVFLHGKQIITHESTFSHHSQNAWAIFLVCESTAYYID